MSNSSKKKIALKFGQLSLTELESMLEALPVDINFVDKADLFQYYNKSEIYSRRPLTLPRSVQNCHPPKVIPMMNEIIEEFRNGTKKEAYFWEQKDGRMIFMWYIAVRSPKNEYLGTMEIIQDITRFKDITGERKTLIWEE